MATPSDAAAENRLNSKYKIDDVVQAIKNSEYVLRASVARSLGAHFDVTEKWAYVDRRDKMRRSIDMAAYLRPFEAQDLTCQFSMLINCIKSDSPVVFFEGTVPNEEKTFPIVAGINQVTFNLNAGEEFATLPHGSRILGLAEHEFASPGPPSCPSCAIIDLISGEAQLSYKSSCDNALDAFFFALDYSLSTAPKSSEVKSCPTIYMSLIVLDAPILVVKDPKSISPELVSWVRMPSQNSRLDPQTDRLTYEHFAVDVVHFSFLDEFIHDHLLPFIAFFVERCKAKSDVLRLGGITFESDATWRDSHAVIRRSAF